MSILMAFLFRKRKNTSNYLKEFVWSKSEVGNLVAPRGRCVKVGKEDTPSREERGAGGRASLTLPHKTKGKLQTNWKTSETACRCQLLPRATKGRLATAMT